MNNIEFYKKNSLFFTVMNWDLPLRNDSISTNQTFSDPTSSSLIIAMNPYTVNISHTLVSNTSAEGFSESVLIYAHDGTKSLVVESSNLTQIS